MRNSSFPLFFIVHQALFCWVFQVKKLMLEQRAGLRKTELGKLKSGGASYDVVTRLKALLVRKDILIHLRTCMPRFEETFETFMADSWFSRFNIAPDGSLISPTETCKDAEDSDEAPVVSEVSTFTAYTPLMNLLQKINRGSFEASICKIARESVPGSMVSMILKIVAFGFQVEVCVCVCLYGSIGYLVHPFPSPRKSTQPEHDQQRGCLGEINLPLGLM